MEYACTKFPSNGGKDQGRGEEKAILCEKSVLSLSPNLSHNKYRSQISEVGDKEKTEVGCLRSEVSILKQNNKTGRLEVEKGIHPRWIYPAMEDREVSGF